MATDKTSASKVQILFLHFEIGFQSKVAKIKKLRSLQMFLVFLLIKYFVKSQSAF